MKHAILTIICTAQLILAQNKYLPINIQNAIEKGTRTLSGMPGDNYWQNRADYKINVSFNPSERLIVGSEKITYYNESPDSLDRLIIRLYQNFYKNIAARNFSISELSVTEGINISSISINEKIVNLESELVSGSETTNLTVLLNQKIPPHSLAELLIDWKYKIPGGRPIRTGMYDSTTFMIAYWYPQIAVYDDIDGWDKIEFNGEQEMYNDFNNFDVEIEIPASFFVWATGVLQNPEKLFHPQLLQKYNSAHNSDSVMRLVTLEDLSSKTKLLLGEKNNIWHFIASEVPDFAFGCSDHYLWDAVSFKPEKNSDARVFISAAYHPESPDFKTVAKISKETLDYLSFELPGIPYPYPTFTAFNGGPGGMEFPMLISDNSNTTEAGTVGLTSHEATHIYFPFFMGINEKKYAWMDEGMAVMLPLDFQMKVKDNDPLYRNVRDYISLAGKEMDMPLIVPSIMLRSTSYRVASYSKPGIAYYYLQDLLGKELFRRALQEYIRRWNKKHPIPIDFFNSFEDFLQADLSWYWKPWFYEFGYPDLALKSYYFSKDILKIEIEKIGNIPIPIKLTVIKNGAAAAEIYKPADIWKHGEKTVTLQAEGIKDFDQIILGSKQIPDVNRKNNAIFKDSL